LTITYFATAATAGNCGFTTHALERESAVVEPVVAKERNAFEKAWIFVFFYKARSRKGSPRLSSSVKMFPQTDTSKRKCCCEDCSGKRTR
jgi:hypothetical protein